MVCSISLGGGAKVICRMRFKALSVRSKALGGYEECYPTATPIFYNRKAVK
jgi:hypothetical protein